MPSVVAGLDIGGANLKLATPTGIAVQRPFALWKQPRHLAAEIRSLLTEAPACSRLAVTMTGELCDCFETKREGVHAILDAVEASTNAEISVWTTAGQFTNVVVARQQWLKVAAANWLATATFVGRFAPHGSALLVDVGSTTADLISLWQGRPRPLGRTDPERLQSRELIYTGARRTPLCALLGSEGAAELFATTLDVYLLLEQTPEDTADCDTADGRPATRSCAHARLSRMLGGDPEIIGGDQTHYLAARMAARQADLLRSAARDVVGRLPESPQVLITAGSGEFLARAVLHEQPNLVRISLTERLGADVSQTACAYAVAVLLAETTAA